MLFQRGELNVNVQDGDNKTALIWACWNGHTEIVQSLLQRRELNVNL